MSITCKGTPVRVDNYRWFLNDTQLEDGTFPGFKFSVNSIGKILEVRQIPRTSVTRVHCEGTVNILRPHDHKRTLTSNTATLRGNLQGYYRKYNNNYYYLGGVFGAVSDLTARLICPSSFRFSWTAPNGFGRNHAFCLSITDTTKSTVIKRQCGIKKTSYTFKAQENLVNCSHNHKLSIFAVNLNGNGEENTAIFEGEDPGINKCFMPIHIFSVVQKMLDRTICL